jgi:mono/diheme cytochrome c family protein
MTAALLSVLLLGAVASCGGPDEEAQRADDSAGAREVPPRAAATAAPDAEAQARQIFATRCAVCHGPEGRGDGPGAAALNPPPRNYHDAAWQDSVTDEEIENAIKYGGAAVGRSPSMVANPDLVSKPEVLAALRDLIRDFGKDN